MASKKVGPPKLSDPTEISVVAAWESVETATSYHILVKSVIDDDIPWEKAAKHVFDGTTTSGEVDGLEPTNTYIFRLVAVTPDGESAMSDEAIIDTLVAGCGGSNDKKEAGCCEIQ